MTLEIMSLTRRLNALPRILLLAIALLVLFAPSARAQSIQIIKDAETEQLIRDLAVPILAVAGIPDDNPRIYIVRDRRFNAFVVERGDIFINYGTILDVETPNALQAVLAHEIAHLAGGHLARIRQQADVSATMQVLALALGVGASVAGNASGISQISGLATAFILASQSVGTNAFMAYRRSEESAADAMGLQFLERAGKSTRGLVDILTLLNDNSAIGVGATPYLSSHPLASERLSQVTRSARASSTWNVSDSPAAILQLKMVQAKLIGFMESQATAINAYPNSDRSLAARYARIITAYKSGAAVSSVQQMPNLIADAPNNPYFHELYGQMLLETGKPDLAIAELFTAVRLEPDANPIRQMLGLALVEAGGAAHLEEAVAQLSRSTRESGEPSAGFALLSRAYAGLGQQGDATLAAAEAALARGDKGTALGLARQAQQNLSEGTPAWLRAGDILSIE